MKTANAIYCENNNVNKSKKGVGQKKSSQNIAAKSTDMQSKRNKDLYLAPVQGAGGLLNGVIWTLDEENHFNERPKRVQAAGSDPLTGIPTKARQTQLKPELTISVTPAQTNTINPHVSVDSI